MQRDSLDRKRSETELWCQIDADSGMCARGEAIVWLTEQLSTGEFVDTVDILANRVPTKAERRAFVASGDCVAEYTDAVCLYVALWASTVHSEPEFESEAEFFTALNALYVDVSGADEPLFEM